MVVNYFYRKRGSFGLLFMIDINMENMEKENGTRIFLYKSERNIEREKFKLLDLRNWGKSRFFFPSKTEKVAEE